MTTDHIRLGALGWANLRGQGPQLSGERGARRPLVMVSGHMRVFAESEAWQSRLHRSWERLLGSDQLHVALHTWRSVWSADPSWHGHHSNDAPKLGDVAQLLRNSTLDRSLLLYEVEDERGATIQHADTLLVGRHCGTVADLNAMHAVTSSVYAQWHALRRLLHLIRRWEQVTGGRLPPHQIVLKTRPDALATFALSAFGLAPSQMAEAIRSQPLTAYVTNGWHELGVSDISFVTSLVALRKLSSAFDACFVRLSESGALPCILQAIPEIVLRLFMDAVGIKIQRGAFQLLWCHTTPRNQSNPQPPDCFFANDHVIAHRGPFHMSTRKARTVVQECVAQSEDRLKVEGMAKAPAWATRWLPPWINPFTQERSLRPQV